MNEQKYKPTINIFHTTLSMFLHNMLGIYLSTHISYGKRLKHDVMILK